MVGFTHIELNLDRENLCEGLRSLRICKGTTAHPIDKTELSGAEKRRSIDAQVHEGKEVVGRTRVEAIEVSIAQIHFSELVIVFITTPCIAVVLADTEVEEDDHEEAVHEAQVEVALAPVALC